MVLVSGKPISFQMNLYDPLYIPRPFVEPEMFASLRPPVYSGSMDVNVPMAAAGPAPKGAGGAALVEGVLGPGFPRRQCPRPLESPILMHKMALGGISTLSWAAN